MLCLAAVPSVSAAPRPDGERHVSTLLLFLAAVIAAVGAGIMARRRRSHGRSAALPPLVFGVREPEDREVRPASFRVATAAPAAGAPAAPAWPNVPRRSGETRAPRPAPGAAPSPPDPYLPGALEIQSASHRGELIRFPRSRSGRASFTLGRDAGDPATHVTLPADTVSGRQARMEFVDARWRITNLSRTNRTSVNGDALTDESGGRWLADGDHVMMGELLLVYRA